MSEGAALLAQSQQLATQPPPSFHTEVRLVQDSFWHAAQQFGPLASQHAGVRSPGSAHNRMICQTAPAEFCFAFVAQERILAHCSARLCDEAAIVSKRSQARGRRRNC
eukprot:522285-Pleurochrysis_carterae.AAC.1